MWRDLCLGVSCWLGALKWTLAPAQLLVLKRILILNLCLLLGTFGVALVSLYSVWSYSRLRWSLVQAYPIWSLLCLGLGIFSLSFLIYFKLSDAILSVSYTKWAHLGQATRPKAQERRLAVRVAKPPITWLSSSALKTVCLVCPLTSPIFLIIRFSWQTAKNYETYLARPKALGESPRSALCMIGAISSLLFAVPFINTLAPFVTIRALRNLQERQDEYRLLEQPGAAP